MVASSAAARPVWPSDAANDALSTRPTAASAKAVTPTTAAMTRDPPRTPGGAPSDASAGAADAVTGDGSAGADGAMTGNGSGAGVGATSNTDGTGSTAAG